MGDTKAKYNAITKLKISDNKYVSGRTDELKAIQKFINSHKDQGGSLLIFGPCGSGKTVCIQHILSLNIIPNNHYISCYKFTRISDFFKELLSLLNNGVVVSKLFKQDIDTRKYIVSCLSQFKLLISKLIYPTLIVLDEIDFIHQICGNNSIYGSRDFIIQELFNIVNNSKKIMLIAISNNLELASYICGAKFSRLPFKPYNENQLMSIITGKLGDCQVINKTALKVVARRIVNSSSDCRKCLDVFSRALSEHIYSKNIRSNDNVNEYSTPKRSRSDCQNYVDSYDSTEFASEIGIHDISSSTPTLSVGSMDNFDMKIQSIPTIHQIVLFSLLKLGLTDYVDEIPYNAISLSAKHVMSELQLNESYELSVDSSLEHLEALNIIQKKDDIVLIKPQLNTLESAFNNIEIFKNLNISKLNNPIETKKILYIKRPWWRRR